jgi:hypothetical protein
VSNDRQAKNARIELKLTTASGFKCGYRADISLAQWSAILAIVDGTATELCEDEGCPHYGIPHICVNNNKKG